MGTRDFYYRDPYWVVSQTAAGAKLEGSSDLREKANDLVRIVQNERPDARVIVCRVERLDMLLDDVPVPTDDEARAELRAEGIDPDAHVRELRRRLKQRLGKGATD